MQEVLINEVVSWDNICPGQILLFLDTSTPPDKMRSLIQSVPDWIWPRSQLFYRKKIELISQEELSILCAAPIEEIWLGELPVNLYEFLSDKEDQIEGILLGCDVLLGQSHRYVLISLLRRILLGTLKRSTVFRYLTVICNPPQQDLYAIEWRNYLAHVLSLKTTIDFSSAHHHHVFVHTEDDIVDWIRLLLAKEWPTEVPIVINHPVQKVAKDCLQAIYDIESRIREIYSGGTQEGSLSLHKLSLESQMLKLQVSGTSPSLIADAAIEDATISIKELREPYQGLTEARVNKKREFVEALRGIISGDVFEFPAEVLFYVQSQSTAFGVLRIRDHFWLNTEIYIKSHQSGAIQVSTGVRAEIDPTTAVNRVRFSAINQPKV